MDSARTTESSVEGVEGETGARRKIINEEFGEIVSSHPFTFPLERLVEFQDTRYAFETRTSAEVRRISAACDGGKMSHGEGERMVRC